MEQSGIEVTAWLDAHAQYDSWSDATAYACILADDGKLGLIGRSPVTDALST